MVGREHSFLPMNSALAQQWGNCPIILPGMARFFVLSRGRYLKCGVKRRPDSGTKILLQLMTMSELILDRKIRREARQSLIVAVSPYNHKIQAAQHDASDAISSDMVWPCHH